MIATKTRGDLTKRQHEILLFIFRSIERQGFPPTLREIGAEFAIKSTNGVNDHIKALVRKGYIERMGKMSRAIIPTQKARNLTKTTGPAEVLPALLPKSELLQIPLLGRVAAGEPILAEETASDSVYVDSFLIGGTSKRVFALRVSGDSMIDAGILDGDYIFVKKQLNAERGQIVVVMIEGEATLKRYYPEGDRIRLQPENKALNPIYVHESEFRSTQILGVVCGVYRKV